MVILTRPRRTNRQIRQQTNDKNEKKRTKTSWVVNKAKQQKTACLFDSSKAHCAVAVAAAPSAACWVKPAAFVPCQCIKNKCGRNQKLVQGSWSLQFLGMMWQCVVEIINRLINTYHIYRTISYIPGENNLSTSKTQPPPVWLCWRSCSLLHCHCHLREKHPGLRSHKSHWATGSLIKWLPFYHIPLITCIPSSGCNVQSNAQNCPTSTWVCKC